MRLFEIIQPRWFIALNSEHNTGAVLKRQIPVYPLGAILEGHLEQRRPYHKLPRAKSFFLFDQFDAMGAHVYEVEPKGLVDRHHTGWLKLLRDAPLNSVGELDHYSTAYWSGQAVPELRNLPWETRVLYVTVLRSVSGNESPQS